MTVLTIACRYAMRLSGSQYCNVWSSCSTSLMMTTQQLSQLCLLHLLTTTTMMTMMV
jgi:hypothetical protein